MNTRRYRSALPLFVLFAVIMAGSVSADPLVTSWITSISSKYARIYTSTANRSSGTSVTTWTNGTQAQNSPAYAGVNEINASTNWVYIRSTGLGGHVMGPWNNPNYPKNQSDLWRFPRGVAGSATVTGQSTLTGMGAIGFLVDGVAAYNTSDGFSYSASNTPPEDATPNGGIGNGDGIWNRDAFVNEAVSFDYALAHNQPSGEYHYHANAIAARYLVGDNVTFDSSTKIYSENTATTTFQHSPIIGWMMDGLPLYGPYGYDGGSTGATATATVSGGTVTAVNVTAGGTLYQSVPLVTFSGGSGSGAAATAVVTGGVVTNVIVTSGGSGYTSAPTVTIGGVRRMISGYQLRDGTNGTTNLTLTGRTTLPAWAAAAQARATTLSSGQYGPAVNSTSGSGTTLITYSLGHYAEDYDYLGDLGYTQSSRTNAGGVFFDLNKYNTRFCVTPEFPNGTWAYFATIKADGTSFYPYMVGRWYYGNPTGGSTDAGTMSIDGAVNQVLAGANSPIALNTPSVGYGIVSLTWSSVEGGTYSVDASTSANFSSYTNKKSGLTPTNVPTAPTSGNAVVTTTTSYTTLSSSGTEYARVNRTALATYDSAGQTASTVSQSGSTSYISSGTSGGTPPTINSITINPSSPTSSDNVTVTANVTPSSGRTIAASGVTLTYNTGAGGASTKVFNETMASSALTTWTGNGAVYPWTVVFTGPQGVPNPFSQTAPANHTPVGSGNQFGLECNGGNPSLSGNYITTTNPIDASGGTSGSVQFYVATSNISGTMGWAFQTSPDGTNWTTRLSEVTGINHAYQLYTYTLAGTERVSSLKLRFQFAGSGPSTTVSKTQLDDIQVVTTSGSSPVTVTMYDDGAHGDGAAGDGVYGAFIPAQTTGTSVTYSITATDSTAASTTSSSASYTVVTAAPVLSVTPSTTLSSSGASGSYAPSSIVYTLANTGTGSMNWTATNNQNWLTLSSSGGTLAAAANITVTASINTANANSRGAGTYSDTITFANTSNGSGSTTRLASLTVNSTTAPSAPVLSNLSLYSAGNSTTLTWPAVSGATGYTLQVASNSSFATVLASQTVTSPSATVTNLSNGTTYYYRVLATNNLGSSAYSNVVYSTQVGPAVGITSPTSGTSTATNSITVTGTCSDSVYAIGSVKVNNVAATSNDGFATWTATVPLGYGTNAITATAVDTASYQTTSSAVTVTLTTAQTYNPLIIPDTITGTVFNLALNQTSKRFLSALPSPSSVTFASSATTTTMGYNGALMWGPTLIMNQGDTVQINVKNNLDQSQSTLLRETTTTVHWHGFHIPAIMDGGPRQVIAGGTTWSPTFTVKNNAATYWYHPHLHVATQEQLTMGAGGFIIVHDAQESALALPRTYGVDDIPLAVTSRRFLSSGEFASNQYVQTDGSTSTLDNYGDYILVNGTINPQASLPQQWVRLRILNAEIQRGYNLGFSDNRTFYVIGNDQGLLNAPVAVTRMFLMVGERVEIMVNLGSDTVGSTALNLMAYNTNQTFGFPGTDSPNQTTPTGVSGPENGGLLDSTNFPILNIKIISPTANPVTALPSTLANYTYWTTNNVTNTRTVNITGGQPVNGAASGFTFNNQAYSAAVFNYTIPLNAIEEWTITGGQVFGHSLHIHDIKFNIIARNTVNGQGTTTGNGVQVTNTTASGSSSTNGIAAGYESGWKDTVYVPKGESVTVIAKYDDFASPTNPYMFHCHMLNHEDGGLMGQFVVQDSTTEDLALASATRTGNNSQITFDFNASIGSTYVLQYSLDLTSNSWQTIGTVTSNGTSATFTESDGNRLSQPKGFYRVVLPQTSAAPLISSSLTATATHGSSFSYQISATNSPISYSAILISGSAGLPTGLSVNTNTGVISGIPTTAGTYNLDILASNAYGTGEAKLVLTVN